MSKIQISFKARPRTANKSVALVYLYITGSGSRERMPLDIVIDPKKFDAKKQAMTGRDQESVDANLYFERIRANVTEVKTVFRLTHRCLTPEILRRELENGRSRVCFIAFYRFALEQVKANYTHGTYRRHLAVMHKLERWRKQILFSEIDENFFREYRAHLDSLGNTRTTISSNVIAVKVYLRLAMKSGIRISVDLKDIKPGKTNGNRSYLNPNELIKLFSFFHSEFIPESSKLKLGYFLFACMTGMRISDVQNIERTNALENELSFVNIKTVDDQFMVLNMKAREIIRRCPLLFVRKFADQTLNDDLKPIFALCGIIKKKLSFHVARHTFATCFLRPEVGGTVHHLQKILKHKSITTTMIYAHILENEANSQVFRLDKLFDGLVPGVIHLTPPDPDVAQVSHPI